MKVVGARPQVLFFVGLALSHLCAEAEGRRQIAAADGIVPALSQMVRSRVRPCNMQDTSCRIPHTTCSMHDATYIIQRATANRQHADNLLCSCAMPSHSCETRRDASSPACALPIRTTLCC